MTPDQIFNSALDGSRRYYNYLKNVKGRRSNKISVFEITKPAQNLFSLTLDKRIYEGKLEFNIRGVTYDSEKISVYSFDEEKNVLTIRPDFEVATVFKDIQPYEITIYCDNLFLILRYVNWYEDLCKKECFPSLPDSKPRLLLAPKPSDRLSDKQNKAVQLALSEAVSYIWGAPGTGKTRYVLAECISAHLEENKKILITAPTNNALEQTLFSVLESLDRQGIDSRKVLRLGIPSRRFYNKYPYACEASKIEKQKETLNRQMEALIKERAELSVQLNNCSETEDALRRLRNAIVSFNNAEETIEINTAELNSVVEKLDELLNKKASVDETIKNHILKKETIRRERFTIRYFIGAIVKSAHYRSIRKKYDDTITEIHISEYMLKDIDKEITVLRTKKAELEDIISREDLPAQISSELSTNKLLLKYDKSFWSKYLDAGSIKRELYLIEAELKVRSEKSPEAIVQEINDIDAAIQKTRERLERLSSEDLDSQIRKANVIAMTTDAFVSRCTSLKEKGIEFDHVFMDEAGYCSIAKGLPLLSLNCPITLLGDHMQLPPICEMSEYELHNPENINCILWKAPMIMFADLYRFPLTKIADECFSNDPPKYVGIKSIALNETYRFGQKLAGVLAEEIYGPGFISGSKEETTTITVIDSHIIGRYPVDLRAQDFGTRVNISELTAIRDFLKENVLLDFAVIAPYRDQISALKKILPKKLTSENRIMTIHSSQGQEWDTVIISVTDSDSPFMMDSTNNVSNGKMLINTAVSRAKKELIIVCDCSVWKDKQNQFICKLIEVADKIVTI